MSEEQDRTAAELWQDLLDKDDRTSPEEDPDMALITVEEFNAVYSAGLAAARAQTAELVEALEKCAERFDRYAVLDAINLDTQSAKRHRDMVDMIRAAVANYGEVSTP